MIYFVLVISLTYLTIRMFNRMAKIKRAWKIAESEIRKTVEEEAGQKIRDVVSLNCSLTGDFNEDAYIIWFAFTADKMAMIVKESILDPDGMGLAIYEKADVVLKRVRFRMFEMEIDLPEGDEKEIIYMGIPKKKMEIIRHHIKKIVQ